jgi:hypothetical protein
MRTSQENSTMLLECKTNQRTYMGMRRLFKRGERVRSKIDGKVMEVLKYIKQNVVEVMTFDIESKEVRKKQMKEDKLSKAA